MKSRTLLLPCPSQQAPTSASVRKTTVTSSKHQRQRTQTISRSTSHHNPFHQENQGDATSTPLASTSLAPISSTQESAANSNQFHQIPTYSTETRESISSNVSTLLLRPLTKEFVASTTRTASTPAISPQAQTQASPTLPRIEDILHLPTLTLPAQVSPKHPTPRAAQLPL